MLKQKLRLRQRKKNEEEEDKKQSSRDEIEEFLSDEAFEMMEKKILKKGFIRERGIKKFIPHSRM